MTSVTVIVLKGKKEKESTPRMAIKIKIEG
jgi:hypothetical protein